MADPIGGQTPPDLRAIAGKSTGELYQLLRLLGIATAPQQQATAFQGLQSWNQQAQGSPSALLSSLLPQVRELRGQLQQAYTGISRRLGPMGGKQLEGERSDVLGKAGAQLGTMFAGKQQEGVAGLMKFLTSLRPGLATQLPQLTESTGAPDFTALAKALSGAAGLAGDLYSANQAPTVGSLNPGYSGFTPAQSAPLAGASSGYGGFSTYGL